MMDALFGDLAPWFTAPALLGTGYLLIKLILGEIVGGADLDVDIDHDFDMHMEADHPGAEFGWISTQSLSAFFMGYGWMGFGAYRFLNMDFTGSAIIGIGCGLGVAWLVVWLMRNLLKLQHSGNVSIAQAVGLIGEVYVTVPPAGTGRGEVVLVINGSSHSYFAIQDGEHADQPIVTHTRVKVLSADTTSNILIVEPA